MLSRRALLGTALGAAALVPTGCASTPTDDSRLPQQTAGPLTATSGVAEVLTRAFNEGQSSFSACFAGHAAVQSASWFASWASLASVSLAEEETGLLTVATVIGEEPKASLSRLALTLDQGRVTAVSVPAAEPLWFRRPIRVQHRDAISVMASDASTDLGDWLGPAQEAVTRLSSLWPGGSWAGDLVVEVPADASSFVRRHPGDVDPVTAGFTDVQPDSGPRIVVNPDMVSGYADEDRRGLLTHEGVHAALRTPLSAAPLMVVEGLAEWAATPVWPSARAANDHALSQEETATLPTERDFAAGGAARASAYARSEVLVSGCIRRWGLGAVLAWVDDWSGSHPPDTTTLTSVYRDELKRWR